MKCVIKITILLSASFAQCTTNNIKDTITQSTISIIREYDIPPAARIIIKGKQEEFDVFTFSSYSAAQEALTTLTPEKFLKPLAHLLSPLLNLFNSPSKIILKAQVELFGTVQEPFTITQSDTLFIIETALSKMHHCTILAPMQNTLAIETHGNISFSSQYAAIDAHALSITVHASNPFEFKNDSSNTYKNAIGMLHTLHKASFDIPSVILRSDKGEITINEVMSGGGVKTRELFIFPAFAKASADKQNLFIKIFFSPMRVGTKRTFL